MKPTTQYRIDTYCLIAFNALAANLDLWRSKPNDKDVLRGVTRPYYDLVHALSIPSGNITLTALQRKQEDPTWPMCKDNCYSPQFIGRMIIAWRLFNCYREDTGREFSRSEISY